MRFTHPDGSTVHLAYCSNVHAAEDAAGIVAQLGRFAAPVRERLGASRLGIGLWLAADAARELRADPDALGALRDALDEGELEVVTFNAFPYRGFHAPVVKEAVLPPGLDRRGARRLHPRCRGALRRAPARRHRRGVGLDDAARLARGWSDADAAAARERFAGLAGQLADLERTTGRTIRVGIEPEPSCVVETIDEAVDALSVSTRTGSAWRSTPAITRSPSTIRPMRWMRSSAPACGSSSASSRAPCAPRRRGSAAGRRRLEEFVEPRFLHQTREPRSSPGQVHGTDDLPEALAGGLPAEREWRVHFHVPVHEGGPETTQAELQAWMAALVGRPAARVHHLEIETYTWTVLPEDRRPVGEGGLIDGLTREVAWTRDQLTALGLVEDAA